MTRAQLLERLARHIASIERAHPVRVGIDGAAAVGKTTLADELVEPIESLGRGVIRARGDDFHRPKAIRYREGRESALGYYRDAFDSEQLVEALLEPLGPSGSGAFRSACHDLATDRRLEPQLRQARPSDILLFDGMFVQRPATQSHFDCVIYVTARAEITRSRAIERDAPILGNPEQVVSIYERRYDPAQLLYDREVEPEARADIVVDNSEIDEPQVRGLATAEP